MTHNKKISAILAVLAIGFLSIYATSINFSSSNQSNQQLNITLNTQSGAHIAVALNSGQNLTTTIYGDPVVSITLNGQTDPAGTKAVMQGLNGTVMVIWNMSGSTAMGLAIGTPGSNGWPDIGTIS